MGLPYHCIAAQSPAAVFERVTAYAAETVGPHPITRVGDTLPIFISSNIARLKPFCTWSNTNVCVIHYVLIEHLYCLNVPFL